MLEFGYMHIHFEGPVKLPLLLIWVVESGDSSPFFAVFLHSTAQLSISLFLCPKLLLIVDADTKPIIRKTTVIINFN